MHPYLHVRRHRHRAADREGNLEPQGPGWAMTSRQGRCRGLRGQLQDQCEDMWRHCSSVTQINSFVVIGDLIHKPSLPAHASAWCCMLLAGTGLALCQGHL